VRDDFAQVRGEHLVVAVKVLVQAIPWPVIRGQCLDEAQLRNRSFLILHRGLRGKR
jgi:hypothetical protein